MLLKLAKFIEKQSKFSGSVAFQMKTGFSLNCFVNDCMKIFFCFELTQEHFKLDFFDNFVNSKVFHKVLA